MSHCNLLRTDAPTSKSSEPKHGWHEPPCSRLAMPVEGIPGRGSTVELAARHRTSWPTACLLLLVGSQQPTAVTLASGEKDTAVMPCSLWSIPQSLELFSSALDVCTMMPQWLAFLGAWANGQPCAIMPSSRRPQASSEGHNNARRHGGEWTLENPCLKPLADSPQTPRSGGLGLWKDARVRVGDWPNHNRRVGRARKAIGAPGSRAVVRSTVGTVRLVPPDSPGTAQRWTLAQGGVPLAPRTILCQRRETMP